MLSQALQARLDDLLAAWRYHDDLRKTRTSIARLASSRSRLDRVRNEIHRLRRGLHPEPGEVEDALASTYCESLGETVFLFAADVDWQVSAERFRCLCGQLVNAPRHSEAPS